MHNLRFWTRKKEGREEVGSLFFRGTGEEIWMGNKGGQGENGILENLFTFLSGEILLCRKKAWPKYCLISKTLAHS